MQARVSVDNPRFRSPEAAVGTSSETSPLPGALRRVGVPRAAARVMAACASAAELCPELSLEDGLARATFERIGGNASHFERTELRGSAFRACVVDGLVRDFFARSPGATAVGLWSLLSTRAHRLAEFPWIDVDSPAVAELRRCVLPARPGWQQVSACLCHPTWLESVCERASRQLLFVLDEAVLPLPSTALSQVLDEISRRAPSSCELLLAFDGTTPVRPASPLCRGSALELVTHDAAGAEVLARYPRLRFVDSDGYPGDLGTSVAGVNAVATLHGGVGAPALAHLRLI